MTKPITVLTVSVVTVASSILPTVALAGSYKGKCFNQLERDMDRCNIVIENGNVHLIMRASSNQGANQLITGSSIKKVERSKSSKRLSKTALWSTIALGPIGLVGIAIALVFER